MTFYKLFNKNNGEELVHPKVGLWNTTDLEEARGMRDSFRLYLNKEGLGCMKEDIIIKDAETDEEII